MAEGLIYWRYHGNIAWAGVGYGWDGVDSHTVRLLQERLGRVLGHIRECLTYCPTLKSAEHFHVTLRELQGDSSSINACWNMLRPTEYAPGY